MTIVGTPKNACKAIEKAHEILDSHRYIKSRYERRPRKLRLSKA